MPILAQLESLASWLVNPWLFVAGAAAILIPILIHLLNKRKFRIVEWAAMDFLLDADKKNRRRIRLENLILLLLRCLAVFLIGLLLARPFIPTNVTAGLLNASQFERIVLLDDSLSMQARLGNESAFELARKRLSDLAGSLAQDQSNNSLTLLVTSRPEGRLYTGKPLNADSASEIQSEIEKLEPGDGTARLDAALAELEQYIESQPPNVNRVVYVLSDLRRRDWKEADAGPEVPLKVLGRLSKLVQGCYLIDAGDDEDRNLAISEIRPEGTLVQGVQSRFDVAVTNHGTTAASDIRVKLSAGDSLPVEQTIDRLGPGQTTAVRFNFTFSGEEEAENAERPLPPRQVKVELTTAQQGTDDRLPADSVAYFPARLVRGIPALIIDGDPSADFGKAESFYLRRALSPIGPVPSGVAATIVTENELESLSLDKFQTIFLLNNYRLGDKTAENIARLEKWVEAGGGLVLMPGDQIDEKTFNEHYWRGGAGLSPIKLENIRGDESEKTWAGLKVEDSSHEALKQFAGQNNPLLESVKVFRWWGSSIKKEQLGKEVAVVAKFNDVEDSPAIVEKPFGKGRVVAFTIPADSDWHNWTSDPSFLLVVQDFVRYLAADRGSKGLVTVGQPLEQSIDLTQYDLDAPLVGPKELKANLQAAPPEGANAPGGGADQQTIWRMEYPAANLQGFYELKLARRDGASDSVLFAANVDPSEGDLKRAERETMQRELAGTNVEIVSANQAQSLASAGTQTEVWWYLLWGVVGVLASEQLLGWFFGRGRT